MAIVSCPARASFSQQFIRMKIRSVVGLGLGIIMVKFLVPKIFSGFENTLSAFFDLAQSIFVRGSNTASGIGGISPAP
jgi:hypothetical protein